MSRRAEELFRQFMDEDAKVTAKYRHEGGLDGHTDEHRAVKKEFFERLNALREEYSDVYVPKDK